MCAACGIPTHVPDMSASQAVPSQPVARFAALRNADCRFYLTGSVLSMMADNVEHVITYWMLWQIFHSPALAGFAVISHWAPFLLFSVYCGSLADRFDCRKVIQAAQIMYMGVSAAWGILFLTDSLEIWHAVVLLIIHGFAGALWAPAEQLMLHDLVGREELPSAVRLNSTARSLGILCGPAVGSALLLGLGPSWGILTNVLIYLPLTLWLLTVPYTGHLRDPGEARKPRMGMLDALRVIGEVRSNPTLISMVALGGLTALFIGTALGPQMPEFAETLGAGQAGLAYGLLLSANAAGAVIGGILLESTGLLKPNARMAMVSTIVYGLVLVCFALSRSYVLSLALLVVAGMANLASLSIAQTLIQLLAPPEMRGRVVGVFHMSSSGLRVGSGVIVGVGGTLLGIHWTLALSAAVLCTVVLGLLLYTTRSASRVSAAAVAAQQQTT